MTPKQPRSIHHARAAFQTALAVWILAAASVAAPCQEAPRVLEAPPELLRAAVPEEPEWNRADLLRQVREEERRAALEAVARAREEARAESAARVQELQRRLAAVERAAAAETSEATARLRREAEALRGERDAERERILGLERRLDAQEGDLERLREELASARGLAEGRAARIAELERERDTARDAGIGERELDRAVEEARRDAEAAWRVRYEGERDRADALAGSLARAEGEVEELRESLGVRRSEEASCTAAVAEAYDRARDEAEASWARRLDDLQQRLARRREERSALETEKDRLAGELDRAQRRLAEMETAERAGEPSPAPQMEALREELARRETQIAHLESALAEARRGAQGRREVGRELDGEVESLVAERLRAERRAMEEESRRAIASAEQQALERVDRLFREIQDQADERVEEARREERTRADRAFRRVLHVLSSREDRERARGIWERAR